MRATLELVANLAVLVMLLGALCAGVIVIDAAVHP